MKAIVQEKYGSPDAVLELREIDRPVAASDEVLVRVRAASVHPDVWHAVTGRPYILRLMGAGLLRPKHPVPGTDMAGIVDSVGEDVTRFSPGDEVFGETFTELQWRNGGAFAEYVSAPQDVLAAKPSGVSFEEAATLPTSGFIAMLNLRSGRLIQPGQSVLINGAGGGVGSIAVQIAKAFGGRVTGVDREEKLAMLRSLGADETIDYAREDFTRGDGRYDLILDVASNLTLADCRRVLSPGGVYVFIGHDHFGQARGRFFGSLPPALKLMARSRFDEHLPSSDGTPTPRKGEVIARLAELLDAGRLTPVVDRSYTLEEVPAAMRYLESGKAVGRIVITP
jgi:NADPH:quinone reductase-like Zn-dependent oxidoreductase